ncbi:unnamed protein product, partial [marine sediment metagenome]
MRKDLAHFGKDIRRKHKPVRLKISGYVTAQAVCFDAPDVACEKYQKPKAKAGIQIAGGRAQARDNR